MLLFPYFIDYLGFSRETEPTDVCVQKEIYFKELAYTMWRFDKSEVQNM